MSFTFSIDKPKNLESTLSKMRERVEKNKGFFGGDVSSGKIRDDGVEGSYVVEEDDIKITIDKKPVLYPEIAVEAYIKKVFRECSE